MMDANKAIDLIRREGLFGLGEGDGCLCCHFEVQGVSVDISCHKSEHCVRVHSCHMYRSARDLERVALVVMQEFAKYTDVSEYRLRFTEYANDHQNGDRDKDDKWIEEYRCCYCHAPRSEKEYLCAECREGKAEHKDMAPISYPWTNDGFMLLAAEALIQ